MSWCVTCQNQANSQRFTTVKSGFWWPAHKFALSLAYILVLCSSYHMRRIFLQHGYLNSRFRLLSLLWESNLVVCSMLKSSWQLSDVFFPTAGFLLELSKILKSLDLFTVSFLCSLSLFVFSKFSEGRGCEFINDFLNATSYLRWVVMTCESFHSLFSWTEGSLKKKWMIYHQSYFQTCSVPPFSGISFVRI